MAKNQTAIRLDDETKARFTAAAKSDGLSLTAWLTLAGHERLRRTERERSGEGNNRSAEPKGRPD